MPLLGMNRHMVIADTDREARAAARPAYHRWFAHLVHLWRLHGMQIPLSFPADFDEALAAGFCLVGSPATVRDAALRQTAETGANYLLCRLAFGDLPRAASEHSVALLRDEITFAFGGTDTAA